MLSSALVPASYSAAPQPEKMERNSISEMNEKLNEILTQLKNNEPWEQGHITALHDLFEASPEVQSSFFSDEAVRNELNDMATNKRLTDPRVFNALEKFDPANQTQATSSNASIWDGAVSYLQVAASYVGFMALPPPQPTAPPLTLLEEKTPAANVKQENNQSAQKTSKQSGCYVELPNSIIIVGDVHAGPPIATPNIPLGNPTILDPNILNSTQNGATHVANNITGNLVDATIKTTHHAGSNLVKTAPEIARGVTGTLENTGGLINCVGETADCVVGTLQCVGACATGCCECLAGCS